MQNGSFNKYKNALSIPLLLPNFAEFSIDDGDDGGDDDDYVMGVMMIVVGWWSLVFVCHCLCVLSLFLCGMCSLWRGQLDALHAQRTNFMQYRSI